MHSLAVTYIVYQCGHAHAPLCLVYSINISTVIGLYPSWGHVKIIKNKSFQSGFRSCVSHRYCTLTTIFACPVLRCWKALRSWTTACCLGSTTSTKRRGRGRWRAPRVTAMRKGPWPSRRLCTPQPWSPSRGELPAEGLLTQTTREFGQRAFGSACLRLPAFIRANNLKDK